MEIQNEGTIDSHFVSLVMMLASACWQQLGKTPNPVTGQIEKELNHAQITIEILLMLRNKTKGNLTPDEERLIGTTISDLQANYADETVQENKTTVN